MTNDAFLIKYSFHKPLAAETVAIDAIETYAGGSLQSYVPFLSHPSRSVPPIAGTRPRARRGQDVAMAAPEVDEVRFVSVELHCSFDSGTKNP